MKARIFGIMRLAFRIMTLRISPFNFSIMIKKRDSWHNDIQQNDTWHNDTQNIDIQQDDTRITTFSTTKLRTTV
jgi:hypothetical protein